MIDIHTAIHAWLDRRDQAAARWLVDTHRPVVLRAIRGWLPDEDMTEDVVQEVFVKAFKALPGFLLASGLDGWLCSIARNTCSNVLRRWKRRPVIASTDNGLGDLSDFVVTSSTTDMDEEAHRLSCITRLLSLLQEQDRRILWLYHIDGLTAADVGQELGLSPGNVRVRVLRSQRSLRAKAMQLRAMGEL